MNSKPLLFILTGPSGSGKTTLCKRMLENLSGIERIVTTTTRVPRKGEREGVDYFFTTKEKFSSDVKKNTYLEYAKVYEHYYGISKHVVENWNKAKDLVICLDIKGAQTLKQYFQSNASARRCVSVFISPAEVKELEARLIKRGTDDAQKIQIRLQMAEKELEALSQFDYHLCSQDQASDWQSLKHIYFAEKMRI